MGGSEAVREAGSEAGDEAGGEGVTEVGGERMEVCDLAWSTLLYPCPCESGAAEAHSPLTTPAHDRTSHRGRRRAAGTPAG